MISTCFLSCKYIIGEFTSAFHLENYCSTRNSETDYDIDNVVGTIGNIYLRNIMYFSSIGLNVFSNYFLV